MIRILPIQTEARPRPSRRGFTLVEMLVATALVVLMMSLFAQVFQVSSGMVSDQKGMAKLDQDVRTMTILLQGDLSQRTFRDVVPFVPNQDTSNANVPGYNSSTKKGYDGRFRRGFFSISENDPNDSTDDVLHLTVETNSPASEKTPLPFSGKARLLRNPGGVGNNDQYLIANPDQPEFDDGQTTVNETGTSPVAEVCWFLRNGNLYRRQLLVREPYNRGANASSPPEEPHDDSQTEFIDTFYDVNGNGMPDDHFWRDFDYSAYWEPGSGSGIGLKFHVNPESLANASSDPTTTNLNGLPRSLGNPLLRFGSSVSRFRSSDGAILGPREFIMHGMNRRFIGRFTTQETADSDFLYPGVFTPQTDPFALSDPANDASDPSAQRDFEINANNGLVEPYHDNNSFRRGDDLVMSNVHEFDIQVWDNGMATPGFVDLGHGNATGHYAGTSSPFGNRYDTWHPSEFMTSNPPYAPFNAPDRSVFPSNGLGADEEVWLRAIRINIRFYDVGSDQIRDLTFTFPLNRKFSTE